MNSYQKLLSNTALFAVSTFGSKVLVFLLMPFYTRVLSTGDYGVMDIVIQAGNLLVPLASVGVANSVTRFGLERGRDKACVFTTALLTNLGGLLLLGLCLPLMGRVPFLSGYTYLIFLFVLMACVHSVLANFIRALGHLRLFAFDGIFRTLLTIALNVVFLVGLDLGVTGYVLATVLSDLAASVLLFFRARLWRYVSLAALEKSTAADMLRYCVPLIPTTVCSWVINISDRYLIIYLLGDSAAGIYAVANKIPTALLIVANIFAEAWQISALTDADESAKERFFSNVFGVYQSIAFLTGSALVLTAKLSTRLLAAPEYYGAWRYIPTLVLATTFACLSAFLASVYMVEKRSTATFVTTLLAAGLNLAGNLWLIPLYGGMGAAASTFASYLVMFAIRAVHSRRLIPIRWSLPKFFLNFALLGAECGLMLWEPAGWPVWMGLCFLGICGANYRQVLQALRKVI